MLLAVTAPAAADGGDVASITWVAANPDTYDRADGGGSYEGESSTTHVRQLRGSDFACGDVVSFFAVIEMGSQAVNDPQTIELTNTFRSDSTVLGGVGFTDIMNITIDPNDPGQRNDGGSAIGVVSFGVDSDGEAPFVDDGDVISGGRDALFATYVVDDLEANEIVVARVDARLECQFGSTPAGNLTASMAIAGIVADGSGPIAFDPAPGGETLVPLVGVDLIAGEGTETTTTPLETTATPGGDLDDDPPAELPLTGDTSNLMAMLGLALAGAGMIALGSTYRKA